MDLLIVPGKGSKYRYPLIRAEPALTGNRNFIRSKQKNYNRKDTG